MLLIWHPYFGIADTGNDLHVELIEDGTNDTIQRISEFDGSELVIIGGRDATLYPAFALSYRDPGDGNRGCDQCSNNRRLEGDSIMMTQGDYFHAFAYNRSGLHDDVWQECCGMRRVGD